MPDILCSFAAGKQLCCNLGCPVIPKIVHRCLNLKLTFSQGMLKCCVQIDQLLQI